MYSSVTVCIPDSLCVCVLCVCVCVCVCVGGELGSHTEDLFVMEMFGDRFKQRQTVWASGSVLCAVGAGRSVSAGCVLMSVFFHSSIPQQSAAQKHTGECVDVKIHHHSSYTSIFLGSI